MSHFLDANIPELIKKLSIDEKIQLLSAPDWWNTSAIKRLDIPAVRMSDGPNGVRGSSHFVVTPAQCLPCATALGSTFDPDLIFKVGGFLAAEAKVKSSVILLAPTCNIQRSPLGGRSFESFSEDPTLSGILAAAYVNGVQARGVAATIKHFVANDQEHERTAVDSVVSERALREIYLYPFMLAQKHAKPWAFMTSYGRIDGVHCSENRRLLNDILRKEWGFDGLVMSDWYGTYSVDLAIKAGLDLEMPGPPRWRTPLLINHCLSAQKVLVKDIDDRAATILSFVQKVARKNVDIVYGDGTEQTHDSPEARQFCRKLTAETIVLLKNEGNLLPIHANRAKKIAVIGPHAKASVISGGGSAALKPTYVITPWDGILENVPSGIDIEYAEGCQAYKYLPTLESNLTTPKGEPGWLCTFYQTDDQDNLTDAVEEFVLNDTKVRLNDSIPKSLGERWGMKLRGILSVTKDMPFELGIAVAGRAKLYVDGKLFVDNWSKQRPGDFFYGQGTVEEKATINLFTAKPVDVEVIYICTSLQSDPEDDDVGKRVAQPALMRGLRLGGAEKLDEEKAIGDAAKLASDSDIVVVVGGLMLEWESEGFDRPTLALPRRQDDLIAAVANANPNTVVVLQAGSAVAMPWVDRVRGVIQAWYSGNEAGNAIADILFGKINPSGKLPLTLPIRIEDVPSYLSFGSENGKVVYREDLFVGYKHYQARKIKPLFAFGHGLSYTTFELTDLKLSTFSATDAFFYAEVSVEVKNTGNVPGSEVIQLYITFPENGTTTPDLQLKGFAKLHDIPPGSSKTATIKLDKYAVSFWDCPSETWRAVEGVYGIHIGTSSDNLSLEDSFNLTSNLVWTGL
ncbi:glycoside hydrolase superfamily [Phellopilus nigrolimitatus]|nr:glycoside hydrolase superfamily [Phellopilus nigrolimitatus]